jgi:CRISPR-associated protein Cas2
MTVIVADNTPPAIRGLLKRWFIEPRPNVFVGSVNKRTREKTFAYIRRNAPRMGLLVIAADTSSQGFFVQQFGQTKRCHVQRCGLSLVAEKWDEDSELAPGVDNPDW